jgi:transcriptional regulator
MYVPPHFDEARTEVLHELIRRHPFGTLVTHGAGGLDANHIPFELLPGQGALGTLSAHVARANPLWQEVADGDEVLVVFRAGDAYISPSWYPSKHETHQAGADLELHGGACARPRRRARRRTLCARRGGAPDPHP